MNKELNIKDFTYELPQDRIALNPLTERDKSKLLCYNQGAITHAEFSKIPELLPKESLLVFNDTRVIPARLHFTKETGAHIEIFLLNPIEPSSLLITTMASTETCSWYCTIGNLKRWNEKNPLSREVEGARIEARLIDRKEGLVNFKWSPSKKSFAEVIEFFGATPLPPYIKRDVDKEDAERYQTIYSHYEGAVAAPTAGLHFTEKVFKNLAACGIKKEFVTLHVSAGTFQPIKDDNIHNHQMHEEQVVIPKHAIETLLKEEKSIIPVGTTSMRTLESLYWFGVKLKIDKESTFDIDQNFPYLANRALSKNESLINVLEYMNRNRLSELVGHTSILIRPGYTFRICNGLITNFHLPGSTLILLVAALIGNDWRNVYQEALDHEYRFLSYGDSSLLIP